MASVDRSLVAHLPLFAGLDAAELDDLLREARSVRHPKDSKVFEQGSEAHSFFLLLHGHVRAEKNTPDGQQIVVRYVSAGEVFGVAPAIGFLQVPEGKKAKNRFHIDIRVAGGRPVDPAQHEQWVRAKSAALVGAGATVVREDAFGGELSHIVMLDPEGNEFCVA